MPSPMGQGLVGHGHVVRLLESWAQAPGFSYVFSGPAHVGKKTLAERFVRALAQCPAEQDLAIHPDVVTFEVQEGKKEISVKSVRENRARLYQSPQSAPRMVAFIPRMDRLNEEGFNALLKVMEEPPAHAVFVSVAENAARIPATIMSRSVHVRLGLVPQDQIAQALVSLGLTEKQAEQKAMAARGRPGVALGEDDPLGAYRDLAKRFVSGPTVGQRFKAVDGLRQICEADEDAAAAWRDALQTCTEEIRVAFLSSPRNALVLGQGIADAWAAIGGSVGPRLLLEAAAVQTARGVVNMPTIYPKTFPLTLRI